MDGLVKVCRPMGNSSAVYVPRGWQNQKVVVRLLSPREAALEALMPYLPKIVGAYMHGSHVRGEETQHSDIDVLVVASEKIKIPSTFPLDIVVSTPEEVDWLLSNDPIQLTPILSEAEALINGPYLQTLRERKIDQRGYLKLVKDTSRILKENRELIKGRKRIGAVIYSLLIRLKAVYLARMLLSGGKYANKDFKDYVLPKGLSEKAYEGLYTVYRAVRDDKPLPDSLLDIEDILVLQGILEKENKSLGAMLEDGK
ncbi:MAG: nucleotidyltransferase domain-containing protein [Candidatus Altiarchaeota archaeon]